jgi:hypothetical protein
MESSTQPIPEFAYYYGDWIWDEELTGWIKSLLLFFDGIALALPPERANRLIERNPVLAQPLAELGLLRNYEPNRWFDPHVKDIQPILEKFANMSDGRTWSSLEELETFAYEEMRLLPEVEVTARPYIVAPGVQEFKRHAPPHVRALKGAMNSMLLRRYIGDIAIEPVINDENAASFVAWCIDSHDEGRAKIAIGDLAQIGID